MWLGSTLAATANTDKIIHNEENDRQKILIAVSQEKKDDRDRESLDPLNSPHPVPWEWILNSYSEFISEGGSQLRYYRSDSILSPDGKYAAYSRIKLKLDSELFLSRCDSTIFIENLETGDLKKIPSESLGDRSEPTAERPGEIAILMPISWSETGDRLLSRLFAGYFSTTDVSDWGVIWDKNSDGIVTLSPDPDSHTHAVLLGWSQNNPEQILFRAGILGQEIWGIWSVQIDGKSILANGDRAIVYRSE